MFEVTLKHGHDKAERKVAVVVAIAAVEIEHTSTGTIAIAATTMEERSNSVREVRVIAVPAVRARSAI